MAGRQLQRLLQKDPLPVCPDSDIEEEAGPAFNPFDLLDVAEEQEATAESDQEADVKPKECSVHAASKRVGRKSKARQATAVASQQRNSAAGASAPSGSPRKATADEDIDSILAELNLTPAAHASAPQAPSAVAARPLLAVDFRMLRAEEELRTMFGSRAVGAVAEEDGANNAAAYANASRRVRRLAARGLIHRDNRLRPGHIVNPKDTWPHPEGTFSGIALKAAAEVAPDGQPAYAYSYSPHYHAVQELYEECQATLDPNAIAALLQRHPWHLDALLSMADVYKAMGENAAADDMVERCLYVLEAAWPPAFVAALSAGTARVAYSEANVPLFLALSRYMSCLGRRGLHRTALEVCKLLLSLTDDDPTGTLLTLDYYAVRCGQYDWLYRFVEEWQGGEGSAAVLPNFAFSLSLARRFQEQAEAETAAKASRRGSAGGPPAPAEEQESPERPCSLDLLTKAVLMHPLVAVRLQAKLRAKGVGGDAAWQRALAAPLLAGASDGGSAGLAHLVDIFVERHHLLWKAAPVQDWLLAAAQRAISAEASGLKVGGAGPADWAHARSLAFTPSEANQFRHLRVHDYSDDAVRLPIEEVHGMAQGGGGMMALGGRAELEAQLEALQAEIARAGGLQQLPPEALAGANPLLVLLQSLLPWVTAGQQPDYEAEAERAQQEAAAGADAGGAAEEVAPAARAGRPVEPGGGSAEAEQGAGAPVGGSAAAAEGGGVQDSRALPR